MNITYQDLLRRIRHAEMDKVSHPKLDPETQRRHLDTLGELHEFILDRIKREKSRISWMLFLETHGLRASKRMLILAGLAVAYIALMAIYPKNLLQAAPCTIMACVLLVIWRYNLNTQKDRSFRLELLRKALSDYDVHKGSCPIPDKVLEEFQSFSGDPDLWQEILHADPPNKA